jgi:glycerol dehydrogenase
LSKVIVAPGKYIQGPGELDRLAEHTGQLGAHAFVIADEFVMNLTGDRVTASYAKAGAAVTMERFQGEITQAEIERLTARCKESQADVVVGIGGGKTLDSAKAVAYYCGNLPAVVVPTVASTDAPCSALSVIYKEDGSFERYLFLPSNPAVVVVDTAIIANAPVRLLVAGMGDALATYFEARAAQRAHKLNIVGGHGTQAAMALARLCYDTLLQEGIKAKAAAEAHVITEALERIVEANTYLSGLGFESCGLAAAHAIHNGLSALEETHGAYHGEKVAFGTLAQLVLENAPLDEIEEVIEFCLNVGLPVTLADLGVHTVREEQIRRVAELSCAEGETIFNMPFEVTPEKVYAAILTADRLGHLYKGG